MIASRAKTGAYLTDGSGRALYVFTRDSPGTSSCTGSCLGTWPAFSVDTLTAPSVLTSTDFSAVTRTDGVKQLAYKSRPLYYYAGDSTARDLNGQGINNVWFAANVTGIMPATPTPTLTPYMGGGGGY
jgi:predicted lipoprotein with Yx(FWY)xxD motif